MSPPASVPPFLGEGVVLSISFKYSWARELVRTTFILALKSGGRNVTWFFRSAFTAAAGRWWTTLPTVPTSWLASPSPWSVWEGADWQVICKRHRREASCHLLATDKWNRLLLRWDLCHGVRVRQMLKCHWWLRWGLMCTICYTCHVHIEITIGLMFLVSE